MSDIIKNAPATAEEQAASVAAVESAGYRQRQTIGQLLRGDLGFIPVLLTLIVIMVFFQFITNGIFFEPGNISNLFLQTNTIGLVGLGVILVLLLGEIDLSVAAVSTLCGVILGILSERVGGGLHTWVSISGALLNGALVGFFNCFLEVVYCLPLLIGSLTI